MTPPAKESFSSPKERTKAFSLPTNQQPKHQVTTNTPYLQCNPLHHVRLSMGVGVPISRPVAGVACGLVTRKDADTDKILEYKILTDISVRATPP